ncbi:AAA family ATPase [Lacipirellula sp.]|uniref:AAA family ATPase n=1 Tax=Lacipirellula sp. TaxID=2691419 RepID=UPI003D14B22E
MPLVALDGKAARRKKWKTENPTLTTLRREWANPDCKQPGLGARWNLDYIDIEGDSEAAELHARELFGDTADTCAAYTSTRSTHRICKLPQASPLRELMTRAPFDRNGLVILSSGLEGRINGVQSAVPPTPGREWLPGRGIETAQEIPAAAHAELVTAAAEKIAEHEAKAKLAAARAAIVIRDPTEEELALCEADLMAGKDSVYKDDGSGTALGWACHLCRYNAPLDKAWEIIQRVNAVKGIPPWPLTGDGGQNLKRKLTEGYGRADRDGQRGEALIKADELQAQREDAMDMFAGGSEQGDTQEEYIEVIDPRDIKRVLPTPIIPHLLMEGCISLVAAPQHGGKSLIVADRVVGPITRRGRRVLFIVPEEPSAMIARRHDVAGADPAYWNILRVGFTRRQGKLQQIDLSACEDGMRLIGKTIEKMGDVDAIVLDALTDMLPEHVNENANSEVRAVLNRLTALADKHKLGVLGVCHYAKSSLSPRANDHIISSTAFVSIPRIIWHAVTDANDRSRHLFLPSKYSYTRQPAGMAYRVESVMYDPSRPYDASNHVQASDDTPDEHTVGRVVWEPEPVLMHADEGLRALLVANAATSSTSKSASRLITEFLAGGEWHSLPALYMAGEEAGINNRTFEDALGRMKNKTHEIEFDSNRAASRVRLLPDGFVYGESVSA